MCVSSVHDESNKASGRLFVVDHRSFMRSSSGVHMEIFKTEVYVPQRSSRGQCLHEDVSKATVQDSVSL